MKSSTRSLLTAFRRGGQSYATQVAGKPAAQRPSFPPQDPKVTRLPNGIIVASLENYSPVSHVSVLYNAGSRYEPLNLPGLTHCIRAASNLSSQKSSAFGISRNLQQIGASLSCTTTREFMVYTLNCKRDDLSTAAELLSYVATAPAFKPWELESLPRRLRLDLELLNQTPNARLFEALHKAAFRDTLGRSLYMSPDRIGTFTSENLDSFINSHYVTGNMAVAGVGVDHDTLVKLAGKMPARQGAAPSLVEKAKYHGGEERIDIKSNTVVAAIVSESVPMSSSDRMAFALLDLALGTQPNVQYSSGNAASKLNKAISAATTGQFAASAIGACYSDAGVFGVEVVTGAQDAGKVLKALAGIMGQVAKSGITEQELQRAKQQLKALTYINMEDSASILEIMGPLALLSGQALPLEGIDQQIDAVSLDAVNKVAKRLISGRLTMAAVGNLVKTPYLDELL